MSVQSSLPGPAETRRRSLDQILEEVQTLLSHDDAEDEDLQIPEEGSNAERLNDSRHPSLVHVDLKAVITHKKGPLPTWIMILVWITLSTTVSLLVARAFSFGRNDLTQHGLKK